MLRPEFLSAVKDYKYLLEKNYPQKGIIKLIGDRYALSGTERTMLYRGITTKHNCAVRKNKLANVKNIEGKTLHIDGYNVMLTVGNYLNGNTVYISNDNLLRDAAEMHGKVFRKELMGRVLDLIINDIKYLQPSGCHIYFDKPVSKSGELASKVNKELSENSIAGKASTHDSADYPLKYAKQGFIATSDSSIIDKSPLHCFDLAHHVIKRKYKPILIDLR
jgi:hypothetical protein